MGGQSKTGPGIGGSSPLRLEAPKPTRRGPGGQASAAGSSTVDAHFIRAEELYLASCIRDLERRRKESPARGRRGGSSRGGAAPPLSSVAPSFTRRTPSTPTHSTSKPDSRPKGLSMGMELSAPLGLPPAASPGVSPRPSETHKSRKPVAKRGTLLEALPPPSTRPYQVAERKSGGLGKGV
eukprot:RCo039204